jgi:heat shock protein HslJ
MLRVAPWLLATVGVGFVLALGGCSSEGASGSETTLDDVFSLTFTSTSIQEGSTARPLASEAPITMSFTEDGISVTAGCNTLFGSASIEGGRLVLPTTLASTKMACAESLMQQDDWLAEFLRSSPNIDRSGDVLTLANAETSIAFQLLETAGMYDTPIYGPEELPRAQALCDELVREGATTNDARAAAENQGYIFRIARRDAEIFPAPSDVNAGRIRVEIENDTVVGCTAG